MQNYIEIHASNNLKQLKSSLMQWLSVSNPERSSALAHQYALKPGHYLPINWTNFSPNPITRLTWGYQKGAFPNHWRFSTWLPDDHSDYYIPRKDRTIYANLMITGIYDMEFPASTLTDICHDLVEHFNGHTQWRIDRYLPIPDSNVITLKISQTQKQFEFLILSITKQIIWWLKVIKFKKYFEMARIQSQSPFESF